MQSPGSLAGLSVLLYCQSSASIKWLEILSHCSALNPHSTSTHRSVPAVNQMNKSCSGLTWWHQTALKVRDVGQANVIIPFTSSELKSSRNDGSARLCRGGDSHPSSLIKSIYHNDLFKVSSPHPAALLKPDHVSTQRASPSLTSAHHCAYSLITEQRASTLASLGLIQLEILSTCMNISNGETSPSFM